MKCNHCGEKIPLPSDCAPGIFLRIAAFFFAAGLAVWVLDIRIWPFVLFGAAGFVALQAEVNRSDLNRGWAEGISRTVCPTCKQPAFVKLWSV